MQNAVRNRLESLPFGEAQTYKNITILPLIAPADGAFKYNTLGEALGRSSIAITEVSTSGCVPELLVVNRGDQPVLLIDGEELAGAKQNRVLNTSILLKKVSETKIPVSCTEQGRWSYTSKEFSDSGNVMAYKSRSKKTRSVHASLQECGAPISDQGEVWHEIAFLHAKAGSHSPTSAMNDAFIARQDELRKCEETFKLVPNQVGIIAFIEGNPVGMDIVSLPAAYAKLHDKLVRSYTLEGLLESQGTTATADGIAVHARKFLDEITAAEERQFPSIGRGTDLRYRSVSQPSTRNAQWSLSGTALVHENEVIHAAFFRIDEAARSSDTMPSYNRRRRFLE
jgi:hypothetical protein